MNKLRIDVIEPYKTFLKKGVKTIEGRLAKQKYTEIQTGDIILLDEIVFTVKDTRSYKTFEEMLKKENIEKVIPDVSNIEEGIAIYRQFYSEENEMKYGVLAIELEIVT